LVNGVASGRGSDLSHARLCTVAVGHQGASAGVVGVDGVGAGGAVDGLSSCVGANLLDVSGHSGVEVSDLVNGVASVRCSDLDDARSGTVAVCHKCSSASSNGAGGSGRIGGGGAVNSRTSGAHASLCHVAGDSGVQVIHSVNGVSKAGSSDLGNAGSSAVAVCDQSTCAGVDVSGRGISASHVVNRLTISIITGLCNVANNTSVQVGDFIDGVTSARNSNLNNAGCRSIGIGNQSASASRLSVANLFYSCNIPLECRSGSNAAGNKQEDTVTKHFSFAR